MPKFFGKIGLAKSIEVSPGIWEDAIVEKQVYGDLVRDLRRLQNHTQLNDDVTISNSFSIVADKEAYTYFHNIRYVEFNGVKWKAESVDASNPPRLVIDVSGVYNE
jgi:hypothetical protein